MHKLDHESGSVLLEYFALFSAVILVAMIALAYFGTTVERKFSFTVCENGQPIPMESWESHTQIGQCVEQAGP